MLIMWLGEIPFEVCLRFTIAGGGSWDAAMRDVGEQALALL